MGHSKQINFDIEINGQGFYQIAGNSELGRRWVQENVEGADQMDASAPCDDVSLTIDIAEGALREGLSVSVNGRKYLGNNRIAA
jgi:hypothetical protein